MLFVLCAAALELFALDPNRLPSQYVIHKFESERDLAQREVQALAQTSDGYLWLGTSSGLIRFDGVRFTAFDGDTNPEIASTWWVGSLCARRSGDLWIGSLNGVVVHQYGRFRTLGAAEGLSGHSVQALDEDESGTMWVGTNGGGVARYDGKRFHPLDVALSSRHVYSILAKNGEVWVGTSHGLDRIRGQSVEHYGERFGNLSVYKIARVPGGPLLIGTRHGLFVLDGGRVTVAHPDLANDEVWAIACDRDRNTWIATRQGLKRWRDGRVDTIGAGGGLSFDSVESLLEDREGNLWVGTHGGGVNQLLNGPFLHFTKREGLSSDTVWSIAQDEDASVWIGTEEGVDRFDGRRWMHVPLPGDLRIAITSVLPCGASGVWIGSSGAGLMHLADGRWRVYRVADGLPDDVVTALFRDRDGALWIGTERGLCRLQNGHMETFGVSRGLPDEIVFDIMRDRKGRLWVTTRNGPAWLEGDRFVNGGLALPHRVHSIYEDSAGDLWLVGYDGMFRLRGRQLFHFVPRHGVPSFVGDPIESRDGMLWLSSTKAMFRFDRDELDAIARGSLSRAHGSVFGIADEMRSSGASSFSCPSNLKARDGRLWFPTGMGVAIVDPATVHIPTVQTPLIEDVIVDSRSHSPRERMVLRPGVDKIEFHYTSPTFTAPLRVRFRVRLEGFDAGWVEAGSRRVAYYTRIPPGRYRFLVQAAGADGRWTAATEVVSMELLPPFQRTWWFLSLCGLAILAVFWVLHANSLRQVELRHRAVMEERARIARDFHDTLAQGFTGVALQMDAIDATLPSEAERSRALLTRARQTARYSLSEARRALSRLRSEALEDGDLPAALQLRAVQMTAGSHVQVEVRIAGTARRLDIEVESELLQIAQEAIANALRHAAATKIDIVLEMDSRIVRMSVSDNGQGSGRFKLEDLAAMRYGLVGMRERAERIGGRLIARSEAGKGTEITVEIGT